MKTPSPLLLLVAVCPVGFLQSSWAKTEDTAPTATASTPNGAVDPKATVADSWERIKDHSYEKRTDFIASLNRMSDRLDDLAREMNAKLTGLPYAVTQEREAAMKNFAEARAYLKSQLTDLGTVTADTWVDAKGKVVEAWLRVRAAYDKVKSGPTS